MVSRKEHLGYRATGRQVQEEIESCLRKSAVLLTSGMIEIRKSFNRTSLEDKTAILPFGIVGLITGRLVHDLTTDEFDIISTYWAYWNRLEMEVRLDPLSRSHQERISHLSQEIGAIIPVLENQARIIDTLSHLGFADVYSRSRSRSSGPSPLQGSKAMFSTGREVAVIGQSLRDIEARLESFRELQIQAADLSKWVSLLYLYNFFLTYKYRISA
jgi:hypothetical protein